MTSKGICIRHEAVSHLMAIVTLTGRNVAEFVVFPTRLGRRLVRDFFFTNLLLCPIKNTYIITHFPE